MAISTKPGARSKSVHRSAVEQTKAFLQALPQKETDHVSLQEAIGNIAESVREAISKGHTYDEVADILSGQFGVSISSWSLKRYLSKQGGSRTTAKRGRRRRSKGGDEVVENGSEAPELESAMAALAATPTLAVAPEPAEPAPATEATPARVRKARTPRSAKTAETTSQRRSSAAKIKTTGRRSKADTGSNS